MNEILTILIVNWNSREYLRRCLETIDATCGTIAPQVIVVDGASFDGCGEMLARDFPSVRYIQSQSNIGFGGSNNLGFAEVTTDAVLLLNPDTELRPGAVGRLLSVLRENPQAGVVGGRLLNSDGTLQTSCVQSFPTPLNQALDSDFLRALFPRSRLWGTAEAFASRQPIEVGVISGACMLLRSETFRRLGGFRAEYFMYGEDVDLCCRLRRLGLKNLFVPDAEIIHHGGGSSKTQCSGFSATMLRAAVETYFRLNHGKLTAFLYRALQAVSALIRLALLVIPRSIASRQRRIATRDSWRKWLAILKWSLTLPKLPASAPLQPLEPDLMS